MDGLKTAGLTLIEVIIVVLIVAIIAGIAYPSYQETVSRSRRAEGATGLIELRQAMEQNYSLTGAYNIKSDGTALVISDLAPHARISTNPHYAFSFSSHNATSYTLQAAPQGAVHSGDDCGNLTLTHLGVKGKTGTTSKPCWPD